MTNLVSRKKAKEIGAVHGIPKHNLEKTQRAMFGNME